MNEPATNDGPRLSAGWKTCVVLLTTLGLVKQLVLGAMLLPLIQSVVVHARTSLAASKREKAQVDLETIRSAILMYAIEHGGRFPQSLDQLDQFAGAGTGVPHDPWGNAYRYRAPSDGGVGTVSTLGSDGREGGIGSAHDLVLDVFSREQER